MNSRTASRIIAIAAAAGLLAGPIAVGAEAATSARAGSVYKNCTELNNKHKHGLGKSGAKDEISGKYVPGKSVTTFKKSTKLYNAAMEANSRLDGDKDGVACEKR